MQGALDPYLLVRSRGALCALPLADVVETMRPLPLVAISDQPPAVLGQSVIRGSPCLVVDLDVLLREVPAQLGRRLVTLRLGDRRVALSVESVEAVRQLPNGALAELSPALVEGGDRAVSAMGTLDDELMLVLASSRIVPEEVWANMLRDPGAAK